MMNDDTVRGVEQIQMTGTVVQACVERIHRHLKYQLEVNASKLPPFLQLIVCAPREDGLKMAVQPLLNLILV
jgi:hypothetical protein